MLVYEIFKILKFSNPIGNRIVPLNFKEKIIKRKEKNKAQRLKE